MVINADAMDKLITEILSDCVDVTPPLTRCEITRIVLEHLRANVQKYVYPALNRLADKGVLIFDCVEDQNGPNHYWLARGI